MRRQYKSRLLVVFFSIAIGIAQNSENNIYTISFAKKVPTIDGILDDDLWSNCQVATQFIQASPLPGRPMTEFSQIRIAYGPNALYIGAKLFDSNPDSIRRQIVGRDGIGNSDFFSITLDTYNNQQSAYQFGVTASGTQRDLRITQSRGHDASWDALWKSAARITEFGWIVEMEIPFSAIRFPKAKHPTWGLNLHRTIRRKAESGSWFPINPEISGELTQMGVLSGLPQLKTQRKVILTPYLSSALEHNPSTVGVNNGIAKAYRGGLDLKMSLNESFIFDMTLIPDFGQVQSDNTILNLSYSEVKYGEHRPFFNEGMELFSSGLFYTRRIGGTPSKYSEVNNQIADGEILVENPSEALLLNALKITGRNRHDLGIGIFNAVTSKTYAVIEDAGGMKRKVLTEPNVNYNVLVLDQAIKNNSSITLINANTTRMNSAFRQANSSGIKFNFFDSSNTYFIHGDLKKTFVTEDHSTIPGDYNAFGLGKHSGRVQFNIGQYQEGHTYNPNDLGHIGANNESTIHGNLSFHLFEPRGILLNGSVRIWGRYKQLYKPRIFSDWKFNIRASGTFKNYLSTSIGVELQPTEAHNYEESRRENRDRKWIVPPYYQLSAHINSDGRKKFGFSSGLYFLKRTEFEETGLSFWVSPWGRLSDQSSMGYNLRINHEKNDHGWVSTMNDSIVFGRRNIQTIENSLSIGYMVSKDMSVGIRIRHYWTKGSYPQYYLLNTDGSLREISWESSSDFNYNAFNLDFNFSWRFLPLSELNIAIKDAFQEKATSGRNSYINNLKHILNEPQVQTLSIKVLYYFDTQSIL